MIDLERSLEELAERLDISGGEWLGEDVVRRIGEPPTRRAPRRRPQLAIAVIAVLVVLFVALPGPRRAVARWLGFDSVRIEPGVTLPTTSEPSTVASEASAAATTTVVQPNLDLGRAVSIDEATTRTGLPDPTPTALGAPLSVHVMEPPQSGQILLVYAPSDLVPQSDVTGVGALVSVMPAHIEAGFFRKTLGTESTVRPVDFAGVHGYWIEGSPHQLFFEIGQDQVEQETLRLATNTLLWERDGHLYRLEADISLETAVEIASSIPGSG